MSKVYYLFFVIFIVAVFLLSTNFSFAYDKFNPPYPRTAIFGWGGETPEWDLRFNLVDSSHPKIDFIKANNSNIIVMPTCDIQSGACISSNVPDEWKIKTSKGKVIKIYGGYSSNNCKGNYVGWDWADTTDFAPRLERYGNRRYNEYIAEIMEKRSKNYDGVATDGLWINGYYPKGKKNYPDCEVDIDLDRDGKNDFEEHGASWIRDKLKRGTREALENIRSRIDDKPLLVNTGTFHSEAWDITNGMFLEHFKGIYGTPKAFVDMYKRWMKETKTPHLWCMDGFPSSKEDFKTMRFTLGLTLLGDGYYSDDTVYNHYGVSWYDEFETNLGYPKGEGDVKEIGCENGSCVFVRFFDNGVAIVNAKGKDVVVSNDDIKNLKGYDGPYFRFKGGQNPSFNNGEPFTSVSLRGWKEKNGQLTKGDAIILLKEPRTIVSDIYVDNVEVGTSPSSHEAELHGNWKQLSGSGGPSTQRCHGKYYSWQLAFASWKGVYPYAYTQDSSAYAIYRPTIGIAGHYKIYEWNGRFGNCQREDGKWVWISKNNEATNVPYEIHYSGGTETKTVNQRQNYGKWNYLGTYYLAKGTNNYVKIKTQGTDGIVIADAVKFVYQGNSSLPRYNPDINQDGQTDAQDLGILLSNWGKTDKGRYDIDQDGKTDSGDAVPLLSAI